MKDIRPAVMIGLFGFAFFGVIAGMNVLDWYNDATDWCEGGDVETVVCVREWIGATSGWAAAIAAAFSIVYLVRQTQHAAKQTEFALGDAQPTASMFDPRDSKFDDIWSNTLQIVNWNRNPILIRRIELETPQNLILAAVTVEPFLDEPLRPVQLEYRRGNLYVPGWTDRSKSPFIVRFNIELVTSDPAVHEFVDNNHSLRCDVCLKVTLTIAGETHSTKTFLVERPDAFVVFDDSVIALRV